MSPNVPIVALMLMLILAAAAIRLAAGPVAAHRQGASLYAAAKFGSDPAWSQPPVEMAASGGPPAGR